MGIATRGRSPRLWDTVRGRLARLDAGVAIFLLLVLALDLHIYANHPSRPTAVRAGWEHFWDQSQYLASARALARGDLRSERHWYPIGYALLAVPFVHLYPRDPFLPVNILCLSIFAGVFLLYFRPVIGLLPAAAAFFGALVFPLSISTPAHANFPIWSQFVVPWSTIPVAAIYLCALYLVRDVGTTPGLARDAGLGVLIGSTLIIKPADVLPLGVVAGCYLWRTRRKTGWPAHIGAGGAGALAVVLPAIALTFAIHGGLTSPYVEESRRIGMTWSNLHERAYAMLVSARTTFGETDTALLEIQPWLYALVPLAAVWAISDPGRGLLPVALAAASALTYLSYNDFWPFNLLRYFLIHYIAWMLPVLTAGGIAGALAVVRERRWRSAAAAGSLMLLIACYRQEPRTLTAAGATSDGPDPGSTSYRLLFDRPQDVDAIDLAGASTHNAFALSRLSVRMIVDGEPLDLYRGYRLILLDGGVRIIFNRDVSATRIEFTLDGNVRNHPESAALVRAIRFRGGFGPFWSPRRLARIRPGTPTAS